MSLVDGDESDDRRVRDETGASNGRADASGGSPQPTAETKNGSANAAGQTASTTEDGARNTASGQNGQEKGPDTPRLAIWISVYHLAIFVGGLALLAAAYNQVGWWDKAAIRIATLGIASGILGGTLQASRFVVYSVRHHEYDPARILWQLWTPLHSGVFAGFSVALGQAGLVLAAERLDTAARGYLALMISLAFIIGFSSELFVKRLISASQALFGEPLDDPAMRKREADVRKQIEMEVELRMLKEERDRRQQER